MTLFRRHFSDISLQKCPKMLWKDIVTKTFTKRPEKNVFSHSIININEVQTFPNFWFLYVTAYKKSRTHYNPFNINVTRHKEFSQLIYDFTSISQCQVKLISWIQILQWIHFNMDFSLDDQSKLQTSFKISFILGFYFLYAFILLLKHFFYSYLGMLLYFHILSSAW